MSRMLAAENFNHEAFVQFLSAQDWNKVLPFIAVLLLVLATHATASADFLSWISNMEISPETENSNLQPQIEALQQIRLQNPNWNDQKTTVLTISDSFSTSSYYMKDSDNLTGNQIGIETIGPSGGRIGFYGFDDSTGESQTPQLLNMITTMSNEEKPDFLAIMIGRNDHKFVHSGQIMNYLLDPDNHQLSPTGYSLEWLTDFESIIQTAKDNGIVPIIFGVTPIEYDIQTNDANGNPVSQHISGKFINRVLAEIARQNGIPFVANAYLDDLQEFYSRDTTPAISPMVFGRDTIDPRNNGLDGIHILGSQYQPYNEHAFNSIAAINEMTTPTSAEPAPALTMTDALKDKVREKYSAPLRRKKSTIHRRNDLPFSR